MIVTKMCTVDSRYSGHPGDRHLVSVIKRESASFVLVSSIFLFSDSFFFTLENSESCHSKDQAIICVKIQSSKYIPGQTVTYVI